MDAMRESPLNWDYGIRGSLLIRGAPPHPPGEGRLAKNVWLTWPA